MTQAKNLQEKLVNCLLDDLKDPDLRNPQLYTVVRGVINDLKKTVDDLPNDLLSHAREEMMAGLKQQTFTKKVG